MKFFGSFAVLLFTLAFSAQAQVSEDELSRQQLNDLIEKIGDCNESVKNIGDNGKSASCKLQGKEKSMQDLMEGLGLADESPPSPEVTDAPEPEPRRLAKMKDLNGDDLVLSLLTPEQAQKLFDEMKDLPRMRYGLPDDGCRARATLITRIMQKNGVTAGKIWTERGWFGELGRNVKNRRMSQDWTFHVSPYVLVKNGDKIETWMIDPTVNDQRPLRFDEYQKALSDYPNRNNVYFSNMYPYDPTEKWDKLNRPRPNDYSRATHELEQLPGRLRKLSPRLYGDL